MPQQIEKMAIYHRLASPTQTLETVIKQVHSKEIWGVAKFRGLAGVSVAAYVGPLPAGKDGFEFETTVAPDSQHPHRVQWSPSLHPQDVFEFQGADGRDYAKLGVAIKRVHYKDQANLLQGASCWLP
ncbi:hypothetical protein SB778_31085 [Paraburkholderia sp. SIMBA_050]